MVRMFIKNKMQWNREKYVCVHLSMLAGPFKQTGVGEGWGDQSVVSQY
jgi:hypothetical protein